MKMNAAIFHTHNGWVLTDRFSAMQRARLVELGATIVDPRLEVLGTRAGILSMDELNRLYDHTDDREGRCDVVCGYCGKTNERIGRTRARHWFRTHVCSASSSLIDARDEFRVAAEWILRRHTVSNEVVWEDLMRLSTTTAAQLQRRHGRFDVAALARKRADLTQRPSAVPSKGEVDVKDTQVSRVVEHRHVHEHRHIIEAGQTLRMLFGGPTVVDDIQPLARLIGTVSDEEIQQLLAEHDA